MLAIKLKRIGKKRQASYRIVIAEKRSKANGGFIEDLGFYNPHSKDKRIDGETVKKWMKNGAQPTDTVRNLLIRENIIEEGVKVKSHSTRKRKKHIEKEKAAEAAAEQAKAEAPKVEEVKEEATEEAPAEETKEEVVEETPKEEEVKEDAPVEEVKEEASVEEEKKKEETA